jgi:hypothetical protein
MHRLAPRRIALIPLLLMAACSTAAARDACPDLKSKLSAVDASKYDADAVIVLDDTDVSVQPNGIGAARTTMLTRILREGGIRGQSVQRFDYDPTTNRLEVHAVRIHRADGTVEEVPLAHAVDQPTPQWGIYWGQRQMLVSVPRLNVGDAVETVSIKTGFNVAYLAGEGEHGGGGSSGGSSGGPAVGSGSPALEPPMPGHWYDEVTFSAGLPIIEKRYVVRMPKDKPLQYEVYYGEVRSSVTVDGDKMVYTFEKRDIPAWKGEPGMVARSDADTKLVLATLPDWKSKSRWFYAANEKAFAVNDEIRATVRDVIANCKTDEEKYTALNHWVAENIRYIGTSRGPCEGYTTHDAIETFRDRGGVCKDKAGLLVAMLRVADFDSYIVMTQAGSDVERIPADQFNHAVTCIRNADGSFRLLDPTWMPKSRENWSSAEQLQNVVYGTPEGVDLSRSPYSGPENNEIAWRSQTAISDEGAARGACSIVASGAPETALRRSFNGRRPSERVGVVEEGFARLSPATAVRAARISDPVDFSAPFAIECEFVADGYALGSGERRFLSLPMLEQVLGDMVVSDVMGGASLEKRKFTARFRSTRRLVFSEVISLPDGWTVAELPETKKLDGPAAALDFRIEQSGGQIRYECTLDLKKHRVPPEEYANYKQVIDALNELSRTPLVATVAGAQRAAADTR